MHKPSKAMAASSSLLPFFFLFLLSISSLTIPTLSSSADSFVFGGCTQQKYAPDSPYQSNLNTLLTSLVNSATYSSYSNYTITGSSPEDVVYGLYQCRGDLSMPDCATCVSSAVSHVGSLCSATCGGAVQLQGCFIKYDNETFLGVEDKTLVLKKCGPSAASEIMGRRDEVMAGLTSGGGPFRVGQSGEVQGLAQCVGDLNVGECQDCLSEAIGQLKSICGTATYGDMYLGKCYARYYIGQVESGDHHYSPDHNGDHKNSSEGEKTFAVIIGLFAGVALVIIFFAFLRRVFEGNGK
ncbi:hypothetical protein SLA2020_036970 [Shorea laevis]